MTIVFLLAKNYNYAYGYTRATLLRGCAVRAARCGPRGSHGEREQGAAPAGDTLDRYG
jgi:hypothetical protein